MGRVTTTVKIDNLEDLVEHRRGHLPQDAVRSVVLTDCLVDTEATMFSLPTRIIEQLGLERHHSRTGRTSAGTATFDIYSPVRLTVQERDCVTEVAEVPDECPPLLGQIPLEMLDFVVDPAGQKLIGNPEHGGEHMIDMF